MKGFKDSTKTLYSMGGYAKGGAKGAAKISKVMGEFKAGTLHSGSKKGPEVTSRKQAVAIALSQARKAGAKIPVKKAEGGPAMTAADRRQIQAEINDMNAEQRARAMRLLSQGQTSQRQQESTMQGAKRGVSTNVKPATTPASTYKKGGKVKGASVERARSMAVKIKATPSMTAREMRTMQKYKAAMDSRPRQTPMIPPAAAPGPMAAPDLSSLGALSSAAPAMGAAPAGMKHGGKTHKMHKTLRKADGGMATSIRPTRDYNASDKDFVDARATQLGRMVGKAKGGEADKSDIAQDKAMIRTAVHKHERGMHPGKPLTKLRKGGLPC